MRRRTLPLIIVLILLSAQLSAQTYFWDSWWRGEVTLENGLSDDGMVNYDYQSRSLIVRNELSEKSYPATNVYSFWVERIYESKTAIKSKETYYSIYEMNENGVRHPSFYRALIFGKVSVFLKGEIIYINAFDGPKFYIKNIPYLFFRDGRLEKASQRKNSLIAQIDGDKKILRRFMKEERLALYNPVDLARIIQFHNDQTNIQ